MPKKKSRSAVDANRPLPRGTVVSAVLQILKSLKTPLASIAASYLEKREFGSVIGLGVNPADYQDPLTFRSEYLATEVLSKYPFNIGIDRAWEAISLFRRGEASCSNLNARILTRTWHLSMPSVHYDLILRSREKIRRWLGTLDLNELPEKCGFGPGATFGIKRSEADVASKLLRDLQTTPGNYALADVLVKWYSGWDGALYRDHARMFNVVRGSRITTVPKDAKKDRLIAIEPGLNIFVQKGIGAMIRDRLRKNAGLDLSQCWQENQELARKGAATGSHATIDLKSASDMISHRLVEFLLPEEWMDLINTARSRQALLPDGSWVSLQKVSSMGNGATFELESMIFYALALTVAEHTCGRGVSRNVTVFGDDIVVPAEASTLLLEVLGSCGFEPNQKKSYVTGPFRESCGKHYFGGLDVTPFYVRKVDNSALALIRLLNRFREWAWNFSGPYEHLRPLYDELRKKLPRGLRRPSIPYGYGDFGLWGSFDEATPTSVRLTADYMWHEGWECRVLLPVTKDAPDRGYFSALATLYHKRRLTTRVKDSPRFSNLPEALRLLAEDLESGRQFASRYYYGTVRVHQWTD